MPSPDQQNFQTLFDRLQNALAGLVGNLSETLTGAGAIISAALSLNHATANAQAISATAAQLTTARTSGTLAGFKAATTSLVGDSGGTYADFWAAAPTDGGGTTTHVALLVGSGHDAVIDVSEVATGEADVMLGANLASAFQFRSAADTALWTVCTTTATPSIDIVSTSTAANDLLTSALSMNSATAAGAAVYGAGVQLTTARSSGILAAFAGKTTSLAGDSGGTYAVFAARAPTDGGGSATHVGYQQASGHDAFADLSAVATGEGDVLLGDNLAEAFQLREGATKYLTARTTNNDEYLQVDANIRRAAASRDRSHELKWEKHDDLFGLPATEAESEWILNKGTDGQALDPAIDTAQPGGVWQLVTGNNSGAVADDGSQMVWGDLPIRLDASGGDVVFEARVRIKTAITTVSLFVGLTDSTSLEEPVTNSADVLTFVADDAVGFHFDSAATTQQWFSAAVDSTTADTGNGATGSAPVADTWQILRIEIANTGATIRFYVNGALVDTLTGAAGVGPDVVLYPTIIANATTTTSKTVDVDWVRVEGVR